MVTLIRFAFTCTVLLAIVVSGLVGYTIWKFDRDLPDYQQLAHYQPAILTRIYAGDGRLLSEYATERRVFVPIEAIPKRVVDAFVSAEDKNFYSHHGIDLVSMLRAAISNFGRLRANRRPVGASTITQQVAKNMLLSNEISIQRKIREILLASRIEATLPKDRILELYLNQIYLGAGAYGVAAAALTYFNKSLDELTLGEAAFLAGLPKAPNRYSLTRSPEIAKARRDWVLERMVEDGSATRDEVAQNKAQPLEPKRPQEVEPVKAPYFAEEVRREMLAGYGENVLYAGGLSVHTSLGPRLQAAADKALRAGLIAYEHAHGGWRGAVARIDPKGDWAGHLANVPVPAVASDVDWRLAMVIRTDPDGAMIGFASGTTGRIPFSAMRWARPRHRDGSFGSYPRLAADVVRPGDVVMVEPMAAKSPKVEKATANSAPVTFTLCQVPEISGALVAMDPHTGRVLAISGGFSFETSQFDRAIQAKRQPGSAIKPFVYLAALENGFTPSTEVVDGPISLPQGPGLPMWTPENYGNRHHGPKYLGPTTLQVGLERSLNALTARVASSVGMEPIAETIERFGIMDHTPREYSMALGSGETTLLRLTTAYAVLGNGGKSIHPTLIDRVQDRNGATIFRADQRPCPGCSDVLWEGQAVPQPPDTRELVADPGSVSQLVTMMQGVVQHGTGTAVKAVGKPIAGKTGTTNDYQDAWFIGFTPDLVAGVYIGFDDPDSLGDDETGGHIAAPVFRDFMIAALKGAPETAFHRPPGTRLYRVSPATGLHAGPGGLAGTEPVKNRDHGLENAPGGEDRPIAATQGRQNDETGSSTVPTPAAGTGGLY